MFIAANANATATATIPAGMLKIFNNHNLPGIVQQCLPHADETIIVPSDIRMSKGDAIALMGGRPCAASIAKGLLYYTACHASGSVRIEKSPEVAKLPACTREALFSACALLARGKGADAQHLRVAVEHGLMAMLSLPLAVKKVKALQAPISQSASAEAGDAGDAGECQSASAEAGDAGDAGDAGEWLAGAVASARQAASQFFGAADALGIVVSAKQRAMLLAISEPDTPVEAAPAKKVTSAKKVTTAKKVTA